MFYLEWLSFYSFFILFNPRGPAYHGFKKACFFLEQGIVRVRANSPTQGKIRFFLRCFLRYIEIIPEYTRSILNFFPFFVFKMLNNVAIINNKDGDIEMFCY